MSEKLERLSLCSVNSSKFKSWFPEVGLDNNWGMKNRGMDVYEKIFINVFLLKTIRTEKQKLMWKHSQLVKILNYSNHDSRGIMGPRWVGVT